MLNYQRVPFVEPFLPCECASRPNSKFSTPRDASLIVALFWQQSWENPNPTTPRPNKKEDKMSKHFLKLDHLVLCLAKGDFAPGCEVWHQFQGRFGSGNPRAGFFHDFPAQVVAHFMGWFSLPKSKWGDFWLILQKRIIADPVWFIIFFIVVYRFFPKWSISLVANDITWSPFGNLPSKLPTGALGQSEAQTETKHVSWRFLLGRTPAWWGCVWKAVDKRG